MSALRILSGIAAALVFWLLAGSALSGFEIDVRVLRPWQRTVYGVAAFVAGVLLAVAVGQSR